MLRRVGTAARHRWHSTGPITMPPVGYSNAACGPIANAAWGPMAPVRMAIARAYGHMGYRMAYNMRPMGLWPTVAGNLGLWPLAFTYSL